VIKQLDFRVLLHSPTIEAARRNWSGFEPLFSHFDREMRKIAPCSRRKTRFATWLYLSLHPSAKVLEFFALPSLPFDPETMERTQDYLHRFNEEYEGARTKSSSSRFNEYDPLDDGTIAAGLRALPGCWAWRVEDYVGRCLFDRDKIRKSEVVKLKTDPDFTRVAVFIHGKFRESPGRWSANPFRVLILERKLRRLLEEKNGAIQLRAFQRRTECNAAACHAVAVLAVREGWVHRVGVADGWFLRNEKRALTRSDNYAANLIVACTGDDSSKLEAEIMPRMPKTPCPICGADALVMDWRYSRRSRTGKPLQRVRLGGIRAEVDCPNCGNYAVETAAWKLRVTGGLNDRMKVRLARSVKSKWEETRRRVFLDVSVIARMVRGRA
jgi:hypothetical protein